MTFKPVQIGEMFKVISETLIMTIELIWMIWTHLIIWLLTKTGHKVAAMVVAYQVAFWGNTAVALHSLLASRTAQMSKCRVFQFPNRPPHPHPLFSTPKINKMALTMGNQPLNFTGWSQNGSVLFDLFKPLQNKTDELYFHLEYFNVLTNRGEQSEICLFIFVISYS